MNETWEADLFCSASILTQHIRTPASLGRSRYSCLTVLSTVSTTEWTSAVGKSMLTIALILIKLARNVPGMARGRGVDCSLLAVCL
jgi:hypothetical protein